jgi:uncharacterized membrane protein
MSTLWGALAGLALGALLAWLAGRANLLTRGGQGGLVLALAVTFAAQGWVWGTLLALTLAATGGAMRYRRDAKRALRGFRGAWQRPAGRDAVVVRLAWPVLLALLTAAGRIDYYAAFVGSLAAVGADAWATELGVLSADEPRLLVNRLRALRGTPGAVSLLGTLAAAGAAWTVGFAALLMVGMETRLESGEGLVDATMLWLPLAALTGGLAGVITDSLLGGTAQALYYCEACQAYCEEPVHDCGGAAQHVRGWAWMTNEAIDLVSVLVGAATALATTNLLPAI